MSPLLAGETEAKFADLRNHEQTGVTKSILNANETALMENQVIARRKYLGSDPKIEMESWLRGRSPEPGGSAGLKELLWRGEV